MRLMKKICTVLLTLCLVVPCFSMIVSAADGKISFSDPETKVGDTVEVKCAVRSTGASLGNVEVKISYDSEALRFESGDGAEKTEDGAVTLTGEGGSAEQIFMLNFQALKEGETKITIAGATIVSDSGAEMTLDEGNSTVKIAEGDPSKIKEDDTEKTASGGASDVQVDVNGVTYTLTDDFSDGDIPSGYEKTKVSLDGQERQMVTNEESGVTLGYLKSGDTADFFLFNEETATFAPYAELSISDTTSIILLSDTSQVNLPEDYAQAELTIADKTFPVWQKQGEDDYYVVYAMNNNGETDFYRYDSVENTYQRFDPQTGETEESQKAGGLFGKIQDFLEKYIQMIVLVGGLGALFVLVLLIVLGVKLHNRNSELDELYDEYGIDDEEDEQEEAVSQRPAKKGGLFGRSKKQYEDDFEDEDDFDDEFATEDMSFDDEFATEDMGFDDEFATESMNFDDEFTTADMGYIDDEFATEDMSGEEDEFVTEDMDYIDEDFPTGDLTVDEDDFATAHMSYGEGDLLDDVDKDEFVVYGGESRTEELTIDDLDEVLGGDTSKKKMQSALEDTFKVDFIDLD